MLKILIYFFMGLSLSMDAFSLTISLGIHNPSKIERKKITLVIGIFHLIMPLIGYTIGSILNKYISFIKSNYLSSIIFLSLAIQMFLDRKKEDEKIELNLITILLLSLTVSIDSLSVGFAYHLSNESIIEASIIFMLISASFTHLGLTLGKKVKEKFQEKSIYLGILIMILMSLKYLFFF